MVQDGVPAVSGALEMLSGTIGGNTAAVILGRTLKCYLVLALVAVILAVGRTVRRHTGYILCIY